MTGAHVHSRSLGTGIEIVMNLVHSKCRTMEPKRFPTPLIEYDWFETVESVGHLRLNIRQLRDMDQALDELCQRYSSETTPENARLTDAELLRLCPYFGVIWPSARALGRRLADFPRQWKGQRGLEIGCGLGLPSLVAAKKGAQMLALDHHPDVGLALLHNAQSNHVQMEFRFQDWTHRPTSLSPELGTETFDFILASDVLYEREGLPELVGFLKRHLNANGTIFLADPGRPFLKSFVTEMQKSGFAHHQTIDVVPDYGSKPSIFSEKTRSIFVYEFTLGEISTGKPFL